MMWLCRALSIVVFLLFIPQVYAGNYSSRPTQNADLLCRYVGKDGKGNAGADYVAGIDINGHEVASADIGGVGGELLPDPITIPIQLDLVQRYGLTIPADITLETTVSQISIFKDGRIVFNDQDITQKIAKHCGGQTSEDAPKKNADNTVQEHGQKASDTVVSSDKIEGQYPDDREQRSPYND